MSDDARCRRNREFDAPPKGIGKRVTGIAYSHYGHMADWLAKDNPHAQARFQNACEDTFLFVGGADVAPDWEVQRSTKNFVGLFEENLRWRWVRRDDPAGEYSTLSRFCIVSARRGDRLADVVRAFPERVAKFDPQNVVYVLGREDVAADGAGLHEYVDLLARFIKLALGLRNGTATLQIVKRWPAAPSHPKADAFNASLERYGAAVNQAVNAVIAEEPGLADRILIVGGECGTLFGADEGARRGYYAPDGLSLSRAGNDRVAQEIGKAGWPNMYADGEATPASPNGGGPGWTNHARTHLGARPVPFAYSGLRRGGQLSVTVSSQSADRRLKALTVRVPDGHEGQKVSWLLRFPDAGAHFSGAATLDYNAVFSIKDVGTFAKGMVSPFTGERYRNDYELTVFDGSGRHWGVYRGADLSAGVTLSRRRDLSPVQARFVRRLSEKAPLTWVFLGDSTDHGANFAQGFDAMPEVVAKNMRCDWGREDDVFVNAAMSGDFTNRAVDPALLRARIVKYRPDVLSVTLGINDGVDRTYAGGQRTLTDKEAFKANMRQICTTAKFANPGVIVVVNAVAPCDFRGADGDRRGAPEKYNAWLKEMFGPRGEAEFASYVLFNGCVHKHLKRALDASPSLYRDGLFYGADGLHPGPNAHLIKARAFLRKLGVDVNDTYLGSYLLNERAPAPGLKLPAMRFQVLPGTSPQARSNATVAPDFAGWARMAQDANPELARAGVGQVFLTLVGADGRAFALNTAPGVAGNRYAFPHVPAGAYGVIVWAGLQELWPDGNAYIAKAPDAPNGLSVGV